MNDTEQTETEHESIAQSRMLEMLRQLGDGPFIGSVSRVGPTVYFGPFATIDDLVAFSKRTGISLGVIKLTSPDSDPKEWWN